MLQTGTLSVRLAKTWLRPQKKAQSRRYFWKFLSDPRSWDPHTLTLDTIDGSLERDKWLALSSRGICVSASVLDVQQIRVLVFCCIPWPYRIFCRVSHLSINNCHTHVRASVMHTFALIVKRRERFYTRNYSMTLKQEHKLIMHLDFYKQNYEKY